MINDIQFDGPDCVSVPFSVTYTISGAPQGLVVLDLAYTGSSSKASGALVVVGAVDGESGTKASEISFWPASTTRTKARCGSPGQ